MTRGLKHLQPYNTSELRKLRQEAHDLIFGGQLIGRADPYIKVLNDIDKELRIRSENPHPWRTFGAFRKSQQEGGSVQW